MLESVPLRRALRIKVHLRRPDVSHQIEGASPSTTLRTTDFVIIPNETGLERVGVKVEDLVLKALATRRRVRRVVERPVDLDAVAKDNLLAS